MDEGGICDADLGIQFLVDNLPDPLGGRDRFNDAKYAAAIDNGQGQEVHDAILTLLREETT